MSENNGTALLYTEREQSMMDAVTQLVARQLHQVTENARRVQHVTIDGRNLPAPTTNVINEVKTPEVRNEVIVHPAPVPQTLITKEVHPAPAPEIVVNVDTSPLAAAIDRQTAALERIGQGLAAQAALFVRTAEGQAAVLELLSQLTQGISEAPAPVHSPNITLPEMRVVVQPAPVTVQAQKAAAPVGPKRATIVHDDGTRSTIEIE